MGFFRRYRDPFLVVLLLAVPFFFLRASISRPEEQNALDRVLMKAISPLQFAAAAMARGASRIVSDYVYLVDVKQDNEKLNREVRRLSNEVQQLSLLRTENDRLRRVIGLKESVGLDTVTAVVTTKTPTEYFRVASLSLDHFGAPIQPNMPVIAPGGAVGVVKRVAGDTASVLLVADSGFGVDVVVLRTGARGFVRGGGDESKYAVRVEYMQRSDEVEVGDILATSGVGCRFPRGLAVAKVTKVVRREFGSYQSVEAEPTVDFSRLEEVLVVTSEPKECSPTTGGR